MEDLFNFPPTVAPEGQPPTGAPEGKPPTGAPDWQAPPTEKPKKSFLRNLARLITLLATLSFWACAGVIAYIVLSGTAGLGNLFKNNNDVMGLLSFTGFVAYMVIFVALAAVVAVAAACSIANSKYMRIAKASNKFNPVLFAVSDGVRGSIAYLFGTELTFVLTWGFIMLWSGIHNPVGYAGLVCIALQALAFLVASIERTIYKSKFRELSKGEQEELRRQSRAIKEALNKKEKKKRVGKLY